MYSPHSTTAVLRQSSDHFAPFAFKTVPARRSQSPGRQYISRRLKISAAVKRPSRRASAAGDKAPSERWQKVLINPGHIRATEGSTPTRDGWRGGRVMARGWGRARFDVRFPGASPAVIAEEVRLFVSCFGADLRRCGRGWSGVV